LGGLGYGWGDYPYDGGYYGSQGYAYSYPGYYYGYPQYVVPPVGYADPYASAGVPLAPGQTQSLYRPSAGTAQLTVRLPANAQLWIDNFQVQQTGPERVLTTPPTLEPGQTYHYTLRAQWEENGQMVTQQRTVNIQAGANPTVDFTQPAPG
jgi:uncharacterized protein (TIGR03000 family)